MRILALALAAMFLASCASTTLIETGDSEAKIFVNGEYLGKGSASYTDSKIVGSTNMVTLKKKGCEDQTHAFSRNEEFDAGACVGGVLVLVPFLWIQKYKPVHRYEFTCEKED